MDAFSALLEARHPRLDLFRSYRIQAGTDLFGTWTVEVTYGRIGTGGQCIRYALGSEDEARDLVRKTLRRRSTAENRIGVSYRMRELRDPANWFPIELGVSLSGQT